MIHSQELKIGNFVQDDFGRAGILLEFTPKKAKVKLEHSTLKCSLDFLRFIPLTDEWIERLGIVKDKSSYSIACDDRSDITYYYDIKGLPFYGSLHFNPKSGIASIVLTIVGEIGSDDETIVSDIRYVHQLQNVCYAITGEELEVKILVEAKT